MTDEAKALVERLRIEIDGGKYTLIAPYSGAAHVLRHGEPWLSELPVGANCWMAMAYELEEKRNLIETQAREIERLRGVLGWYEKQANDCRKITREGDGARYALDRDGGERARAALAGDSHD